MELALFGLAVLVVPAVLTLGALALAGLLVASLASIGEDSAPGGESPARLSPRPDPA